jgi:DNA mismatch repair ATPase MutS
MFVPAEYFCPDVRDDLFTDYRPEEDATMKSEKLDKELARMSGIIDVITPGLMVLFNESFAATNDRRVGDSRTDRRCTCGETDQDFFATTL